MIYYRIRRALRGCLHQVRHVIERATWRVRLGALSSRIEADRDERRANKAVAKK
jgi:hypothetical protein